MQTLQTWLKILETRTKGTKFLQLNVLSILSLKQFANLQIEIAMQKKRMQNKIMQTKHTLNVKITINVIC